MTTLNHAFCVEHAMKYGIECAILISHLQFWIGQNQKLARNFHDGRTWMYQTQKEIAACYPYWSEDTVWRLMKKLLELDVLIKGNYNKTKFDQTAWYAFKNEEIFIVPRNHGINAANSHNPTRETAVPIPDTKPDTNQIQQQQSVAVPLKDINIDFEQKVLISKLSDEKTLKDAIGWATHPKNPPTKCLAASLKFAIKNKLSPDEFNKKKLTPYEQVKEFFQNGKKYNNADCYLSYEEISFSRGYLQDRVKLDSFFSFQKLMDVCEKFQIKFEKQGTLS